MSIVKMGLRLLPVMGLLSFATPAFAQKTTLKKENKPVQKPPASGSIVQATSRDSLKEATVSVYQTYEPEMRPVVKPAFTPSFPTPVAEQSIPQQITIAPAAGTTTYYPIDIKPLALQPDSASPPRYGYNKLGIGNRGSLLFESAGMLYRSDDFRTGLYSRYQRQNDPEVANRRYRISEAILSAGGRLGNGTLDATADIAGRKYGEYGFHEQDSLPQETFRKYLGAGIHTRYKLETGVLKGLAPEIGFRIFDGPQIGTEKTLSVGLGYERVVTEHLRLQFLPQVRLTSAGIDGNTVGNSYATLGIAGVVRQNRLFLHAGFVPVAGRDGYRSVMPDAYLTYQLVPQKAEIRVGWEGKLLQNRFEDLTLVHPYLNRYYPVQTKAREAYGQLSGNLTSQFYFRIRASAWNWQDLPVFINEEALPVLTQGFVLQTLKEVRTMQLQTQVRYSIGEGFQIGGFATFTRYNTDNATRVWHMPGVEAGGDFYARIRKKLQLGATLRVQGLIYARAPYGSEIRLKPITDLRITAEYPIVPNWSVWVQGDNLLNYRNERYYGYPAIARSFMGGIRVKL